MSVTKVCLQGLCGKAVGVAHHLFCSEYKVAVAVRSGSSTRSPSRARSAPLSVALVCHLADRREYRPGGPCCLHLHVWMRCDARGGVNEMRTGAHPRKCNRSTVDRREMRVPPPPTHMVKPWHFSSCWLTVYLCCASLSGPSLPTPPPSLRAGVCPPRLPRRLTLCSRLLLASPG
jgi:hypothetical protein